MGQGWSNTGAATAAAAAEGPPAGAVPEVMAKRKKRNKKRKQKVADAKENGIVEQEAASVTAPVGGAEVNGKVELESPAAAAAVTDGTAKHKRKKRKREQEVVNAKENGTVQQEAASATSTFLALEGMPKSKTKEEVKAKERVMTGQEAAATAVSALDVTPKCEEGKAEGRGIVEEGTTTSSFSAPEGTTNSKRKKLKKKMQEQQEPAQALSGPGVVDKIATSKSETCAINGDEASGDADVSMDPGNTEDPNCSKAKDANNNNDEKTKEREMVEQGTTTSGVSAPEGTTKRKRKKLKKMTQEQQEPTDALSSLVKPGNDGTNAEGTSGDADVSTDLINAEDPNYFKAKDANDNDKKKAKERQVVEQGITTSAVSVTEGTPEFKEEKEETGVKEQEASTSTVSAPEATMNCKRKKLKKKKKQEQQEPAHALSGFPVLDKIAASKPVTGATKGEGASGDTDVSMDPINVEDPNCSKAKDTTTSAANNNKVKTKRREIVEHGTTASAVSAPEGTAKCKKKRLKRKMQEQQEPTQPLSGLAVVDKIAASKPVTGVTNREGPSGDAVSMDPVIAEDPNCSKAKDVNVIIDKENPKERDMVEQGTSTVLAKEGTPKCNNEKEKERGIAEQEVTTGTVSAPEGTTKHKRKKLKKNIQEQEPAQVLSGLVTVDEIVASKPVTGGTNGEGPFGDADVSMDPINAEDPNSSKAKDANDKDKAKGREMVEQGTTTSAVSGRVAKHCLDSSMDHDLSSTCASCLVQAPKENVRNIYSTRGSLIRFQRKKLLILDLNGLLADINMDNQNAHMAHAKVRGKLVFRRPYYEDFLRFCFQNFELGIWSSRKMENVYSVVDILMRDLKQHLLFCWDMSKCTFTGHKVIGDKHKPLVLKELKKLWNKEDPNLPWVQGEFSPSNTLLVDDSPYKALCNPPHTAIFPQPYSYLNEKDDFSLGPGGDLRVYLERLAAADDVQVFVRDNPFGQPSITESDPKWNFYSKIVNKVERGFSLKWKF